MIKWNGRSFQGKTFQEVYDIIAESRPDPQVELLVSRNLSSTTGPVTMPAGPTSMASRRITAQTQWRQKHPETIPGQPHHKGNYTLHAAPRLHSISPISVLTVPRLAFSCSFPFEHVPVDFVLGRFCLLLFFPSMPSRALNSAPGV